MAPSRKIIGEGVITAESIIKERESKKFTEYKIIRRVFKGIILECGHKIPLGYFEGRRVPKNRTSCRQCIGKGVPGICMGNHSFQDNNYNVKIID